MHNSPSFFPKKPTHLLTHKFIYTKVLAFPTVIVDATTKISKLTLKDQKTLQAEKAKTSVATASPIKFVSPFVSASSTLSNIATGDVLFVVNATENIKTKEEFTASEIKIMPK